MNKVEIDCAEVFRLKEDVFEIRYKHDADINLENAKKVEQVLLDFAGGSQFYCLVDTSGRFNLMTPDAQKYMAQEAIIVRQNRIKCSAVVVDNLSNRLMTKFFMQFHRPEFSMKTFSNRHSGLEWIQDLKKSIEN